RQRKRCGTRGHSDAVRNLAVFGEISLEQVELAPQRERARAEHASECVIQFPLDSSVLALQCDEAHELCARVRDQSDCLHEYSPLFVAFDLVYVSWVASGEWAHPPMGRSTS